MYSDRSMYPYPQMLVTDIRLGEESGVQFLRWLRSRHDLKDLPVMVISGTASAEDVRAVKQLGAGKILEKPSDPARLKELLLDLTDELCGSPEADPSRARKRMAVK